MSEGVILCSPKLGVAAALLAEAVGATSARALAIASAYWTVAGAEFVLKLQKAHKLRQMGAVVGLSGEVTHPNAIRILHDSGVEVRFATHAGGVFHPKLLIAGESLANGTGELGCPVVGYLGSANFTGGGLYRNVEACYISSEASFLHTVANCFRITWHDAMEYSDARLHEYERKFSAAMRLRSALDLEVLGVADPPGAVGVKKVPAIFAEACSTVWVGLQSFTGEHTFQVEFPVRAGEALRQMLGGAGGEVEIGCADGQIRKMKYAYYDDNSMYRLNVPNDVPLVEWAREHKSGALVVSRSTSEMAGEERLTAEIVRGRREGEVRAKSKTLGTLGSTRVRQYGWF